MVEIASTWGFSWWCCYTLLLCIMEQVHETHKASKFEPQDFISGMPDNVITNILDCLPIQDSVKTSVLSKSWKFKWTLLTRLIFDEDFFRYVPDEANIYDGKIINRLLLHLKGPITKFVLYIPFPFDDVTFDYDDIDHWVIFLSRRGIKEITLKCMNGFLLDLPTQLYSCMELKHLDLYNVFLPPLCGFHGFPNLLSLHLNYVHFSKYTFGMFIARCPLLEILSNSDAYNRCEPGLIEISKLGNLKKLSWSVCRGEAEAEPMNMIKSSSFHQLSALPKLEELNFEFGCGKFLAEAGFDKKVPAAFLCLKTLTLSDMNLSCDITASFVLKMICNSPNLQTLNITREYNDDDSPSAVRSLDLGWNTMKQLQLRSVVFSRFRGLENEVCLIKLILACSPFLKKIVISVDQYFVMGHASSKRLDLAWGMARKLLKLHRASPIVEIDFC